VKRASQVKIAIIVASALAAVGVLAATQATRQAASNASGAGDPAPIVATRLATAEIREVPDVYPADAVIEAVHAATVSAQIAGNVTRFYVDAGDRVRRGQLLVRIDTRETDAQVAAGAANVAQAEAQVAQARLNYDRTAKLLDNQFVSQAALDKADADLKSARAALQLAQAGASQATTARTFAEVRAPIDGVVTRRLAELGELAAPGKPLLEVHDPSALRAVASAPQFVLPQISRARRADIVLPALGMTLAATQITVLPAADPRLLSTQVRADLPRTPAAAVLPGMAAKVLLPVGTAKRLVIPATAVVRRSELTAVYVAGETGAARLRQVRLGEPAGDGLVEVLAGLDPGERVVLNGSADAATVSSAR
jgi:membrane fusion protein, multidrug efflux system